MDLHNIYFNNTYLNDIDFYVAEYPAIDEINEIIESTQIEGRNGSLTEKKGYYEDRIVKVKLRLINNENIEQNWRNLYNTLFNVEDNRLIYEVEDKCYRVKNVVLKGDKYTLDLYKDIVVTFVCEPFLEDLEAITLENESEIYNQGDFEIYPIIELTGTGNMQITFNGDTMQISNVVGKAIINSDLMTVVNLEGRNLQNIGDFPSMATGVNKITTSSNVTDVKVTFTNKYR